ncbi:MAG: hypothetical protein R2940_07950 [Syntrophotaleaceae bacterium]
MICLPEKDRVFQSAKKEKGMPAKVHQENREKEAIRRHLLASMLLTANMEQTRSTPSAWAHFWQGLFRKNRMP